MTDRCHCRDTTGRRVAETWRHKGGRKPAGVTLVRRGTRWGNPYTVKEWGRDEAIRLYREYATQLLHDQPDWLEPLRGQTLACNCKPDEPCHADVLLDLLRQTCCAKPRWCDHMWCHTCDDWAKDTGGAQYGHLNCGHEPTACTPRCDHGPDHPDEAQDPRNVIDNHPQRLETTP